MELRLDSSPSSSAMSTKSSAPFNSLAKQWQGWKSPKIKACTTINNLSHFETQMYKGYAAAQSEGPTANGIPCCLIIGAAVTNLNNTGIVQSGLTSCHDDAITVFDWTSTPSQQRGHYD